MVVITKSDLRKLIEDEFTLSGEFALSGGGTSATYVDCRAAMLSRPRTFRKFLEKELKSLGWPVPVATGAGGALMLATVGDGFLWNPKGHGVEWSPKPLAGTSVALFDDVKTTGGTLKRLRAACIEAGLTVKGEVVLYDRNDPASSKIIYLASPYSSTVPWVVEQRVAANVKAVADLQRMGHLVFSPIVHCHTPATEHSLPTDFEYWQHMNWAFISRCDEVWVLGIDGWENSRGVRGEVFYAERIGKPVKYLDKDTYSVTEGLAL